MLTVEQARIKLGKKYENCSDEEIKKMLDFFYSIAYMNLALDKKPSTSIPIELKEVISGKTKDLE